MGSGEMAGVVFPRVGWRAQEYVSGGQDGGG